VSPRTREDARLSRAYVTSAFATSPAAARAYLQLRRDHAAAYTGAGASDDDRRYAAALNYAISEADAALTSLEVAA
jgi:hypothetical protein